jgi:hypothetical protein
MATAEDVLNKTLKTSLAATVSSMTMIRRMHFEDPCGELGRVSCRGRDDGRQAQHLGTDTPIGF